MSVRPQVEARVEGRARVDRRTKRLLARLRPGEIAVIDHLDLDRIAAEGLIEGGAAAVINASKCVSGAYPNVGPLLIAAAGIPLIDDAGPELLDAVAEGDAVMVQGDNVMIRGEIVAKGARQDLHSLEAELEHARRTMGESLERFVENTLEHLRKEHHLLLDSPELPELHTRIKGRHALIVARGTGYRNDLKAINAYIREMRPVLIAVDGGADALLEAGHRPDVIIGDFDSVATNTLTCGAELVVHAYADGRAPGAARLESMKVPFTVLAGAGTSEDVAMVLAYEKGAELIVAVGTHASAVEFLEKGRAGMASTFLVRLKVGTILVDAKGVGQLYQGRVRKRDLLLLVGAATLAMVAIGMVADAPRLFFRSLWSLVAG